MDLTSTEFTYSLLGMGVRGGFFSNTHMSLNTPTRSKLLILLQLTHAQEEYKVSTSFLLFWQPAIEVQLTKWITISQALQPAKTEKTVTMTLVSATMTTIDAKPKVMVTLPVQSNLCAPCRTKSQRQSLDNQLLKSVKTKTATTRASYTQCGPALKQKEKEETWTWAETKDNPTHSESPAPPPCSDCFWAPYIIVTIYYCII